MGFVTGGGKTEAEKECQIKIGNKPETKTTPQKVKTQDNKQEPMYVPKL